MRHLTLCLLLPLLLLSAHAESAGIENLANFQDGWGNTGGFWRVTYNDQSYLVLKIRNKDKKGAADIVFDEEKLNQFEANLLKLKRARNTLKNDGFLVNDVIHSGESVQHMVIARLNGAKLKTVQVVQHKDGTKLDHSIALTQESYNEIKLAIKKVRRILKWQ